ncbi:flagellar basal body protein FliL [Loktanella sp. 3ANDIMAR09]|uniref:flagellar basal body-associated FliL family protein n=1 Tax=Loktanella sp. 3ANDIMAR09 TaxID=1225657 RepID=UPI0007020BA9|nr:flagellar basal body-associated FliL family protein [Loktanella sp. 3ANDIMAR09]KQI69951.1 flagellar basal body protein FliL [Loktanella sp. 3ANDIMAR09]
MAEATATDMDGTPKRSKLPLFIGVLLAVLAAAGAYFGVSRMLFAPEADAESGDAVVVEAAEVIPPVAFVPLEPMIVSLRGMQSHLRFSAQVEVAPGAESEVAALMPRMIDVLNDYLRAVDAAALSDPGALIRLRSQMLRRLQIVVGDDRVRDLLIMEFVIN